MRPPTPSLRLRLVAATRRHFTALPLLLILLTFFSVTTIAAVRDSNPASDEVYDEADEETARVVRISFLRGKSWIQRAGAIEWEQATLNLPLVEGDRLATSADARLELQLDRDNFIRLDHDATLAIVTLRAEGIALSLSEGTMSLRLARFEPEREYFEIDAPNTTVACERTGLYRLDAKATGGVRLTVRNDGRARLFSERDAFTVRNNRTAERLGTGADAGEWDSYAALPADIWDDWTHERDRYIARRTAERDEQPYDRDVWGAEELDEYGDWAHTKDYGWVWRPRASAISVYGDWAPYRYGHWRWCPPYGWTWVADEPWGWAPYHYGRWVYADDGWCWTPRFYGYRPHLRNRWRPALVVFVFLNRRSYSNHVAWYPLDYHQPYRRHHGGRGNNNNARNRDSLTPLRREEIAQLERVNPARLRAITSLPAREFGLATVRGRAARADEARDVLASEPVRGNLPVIPAGASADHLRIRPSGAATSGERQIARGTRDNPNTERDGVINERDVIVAARPPAAPPTRSIDARATGAATRERGVRLEGELRARSRDNRDSVRPRDTIDSRNNGGGAVTSGSASSDTTGGRRRMGEPDTETGVFTRPTSPARTPRERIDRDSSDARDERGRRDERRERGTNRAPIERDANRPDAPTQGDIFTRPNTGEGKPERAERPDGRNRERENSRPPRVDGAPDSSERPSIRDERRERPRGGDDESPARFERPRPSESPRERPEPRPEPVRERQESPRESRPEPERERPEPVRESRPEPPAESRPEPRAEPRPEPRPDPPAERTEQQRPSRNEQPIPRGHKR